MLFSVFGSPISHSLSPVIHQDFAQQFNLNLTYTKTLCSPSEFLFKLTEFKNKGGIGANITAPLKQLAFSLCDNVTTRAQLAESVNTLYWEKNKLVGDNTDGIGFERDIYDNAQQSFESQHILILGAGGAASGILPIILQHQPRAITILNRDKNRAEILCSKYDGRVKVFSEDNLNYLKKDNFDWVINTAGQFWTLDKFDIDKKKLIGARFYDLFYDLSQSTFFLQNSVDFSPSWCRDGLGMLIEQAAESFHVWHHKKPNTKKWLEKI